MQHAMNEKVSPFQRHIPLSQYLSEKEKLILPVVFVCVIIITI